MAIKPTDQEIAELYREASGAEPPAALDRSILQAARAAVATKPLPSPWWQRWRLQIPVLASLIVAGVLVVMVERRPPETPALGPIALNTQPPAAEPARAESVVADKAPPPVAETRARMAESAPARRVPAAPAASVAPAAPVASIPREISEPVAAAGASAVAANALPPAADAAAPAMAKSEATGSAEARMAARQAAAPAAKLILPAREWLDAIQLQISQGRIVEARASLEAFERAYPAVIVPEAMRNRLKQ